MTQAPNGRGDFEAYLHRFRIRDNPNCFCCRDCDTAKHILFWCPGWQVDREVLRKAVSCITDVRTLKLVMLWAKEDCQILHKIYPENKERGEKTDFNS